MSPQLLRTITGLFFLSGALGLVYEVVWAKYLGVTLGHTGLAHAVVLATFMGGLAIGNALLGRVADRARSQLYLYGWLEVGVGVFAALSPALLHGLSGLYHQAAVGLGLTGAALAAAKIAVAAVALLPPTILMGGTLPALSRFITRSMATMQTSIARLYFLNSFGAVAGSLTAGFVWVPAYGLERALMLGAVINVGVGLIALALSKRVAEAESEPEDASEADAPVYGATQVRLVLFAIAVSGLVSLAYEVAWIRLLTLVLGSSTYSFSLMLAAFVGGIATGSWLVHQGRVPGRDPYVQFGWAQWGIALSVLLTLPLYGLMPQLMMQIGPMVPRAEATFYLFEAIKFGLCFLLMLAPATCIGMTLPLASRVATRAVGEVGARVGTVFSLNTLGNVAGALLAGLVLLPWIGMRGVIELGVVVNVLLGGLIVLGMPALAPARRWAMVGVPLVVVAAHHWLVPGWDARFFAMGTFRHGVASVAFDQGLKFTSVFHRDDPGATIDVLRWPNGELSMNTNGKTDATSGADLATQKLLGQLPMLLRPDSEDVLVVGLGSGVTVGSVLTHPVKAVDVVEITPAVVEAHQHFAHVNGRPLEDRRVKLHIDDASSHLRLSPRRYDIVISEPSNPWVAGVGNLFTTEFYEEVARRLKPGGLMVQWFHAYEMDDETFKLVLRTFAETYPQVSLWQIEHGDLMLVGSREPVALDAARAAARMAVPAVKQDLSLVKVDHLSTLLSLQAASDVGVRRMAGTGPLNRIGRPILEYEAPKAVFLHASASIYARQDERQRSVSPGSSPLLMGRYLAERGQPLTGDELEAALAYQTHWFRPGEMPQVQRVFIEAWMGLAPASDRPRWRMANWLREQGRLEEARTVVESLVASHPDNALYLDTAIDLDFELMPNHGSYLGYDRASYQRMRDRVARLRQLQPATADSLDRRMAAIAFASGHLAEGYRHLDACAARAKPDERPVLWLLGAQAAFDDHNYAVTASYLRRALADKPDFPPALALAEELTRVAKKPQR